MNPITLPSSAVRSAFAVLTKLIPARSTLPVLQHVRIERVENRAVLAATDLDRWLSFTHRVEPDPITPLARTLATLRWKREAGALLVPRDTLRDVLKAVDKDGAVSFALQELPPIQGQRTKEDRTHRTLLVSYPMNGQPVTTPVETWDAGDFPPEPEVEAAHACVWDATARAALIEADIFASTDETRFVLNGVLLETRQAGKPVPPVLVATDGRRLYHRAVPCAVALRANCIIPSGAIALLGHPALLSHDWKFSTSKAQDKWENPHLFHLSAGPWKLAGKLLEGNYPNYRQVMPSDAASTARLAKDTHRQLLEILARLPAPPKGGTRTDAVTLRFHRDRLGIEDPNSKASLTVPAVRCDGRPKVISLSRYLLREMLATGPGIFRLIDEMSPIRYDTTTNAVHVLMPMRVA